MQDILIEWIEAKIAETKGAPALLFVSGAQGVGKTTALRAAQAHFKGRLAVLGLDDFYLTLAEREQLAKHAHPLFVTRGPPGTHDLARLNAAIDALQSAAANDKTLLPVFDKRIDDRAPEAEWTTFVGAPEAIILEGWLIGALSDPAAPRASALNRIEAQDAGGAWRAYQEARLAADYAALWDRADAFFHILAPSFETVLGWRIQQEETTLGLNHGTLPDERRAWVETFILHYERITRRMLAGERRAGEEVRVDETRQVLSATTRPPLIVFSDLDGTLLDHDNYSFSAALPALEALMTRGALVVLASSKTAAEIADLRDEIGLSRCPAIVENGAGLLAPAGGRETQGNDGEAHKALITQLNALPTALREKFEGFSDWSIEEIAERTGLSHEAAGRAAQRRFTEPGVWTGSEDELGVFAEALCDRGVSMRRGGRFLTLSFGATKADRMKEIVQRYSRGGAPPVSIALGDAPNDIEMIEAADYGVIIANSHGAGIAPLPNEAAGRISRTIEEGPKGWNQAILDILMKLGV